MKRKLTLGLLVFFLGVFITACGSEKSTPNISAANTKDDNGAKQYVDSSKSGGNCAPNCSQTYSGQFVISDQQLYVSTFGYPSGQQQQAGTFGTIQAPFTNDGGYNQNFATSVGNCLFGGLLSWGFSYLTGSEAQYGCGYEQTTTTTMGTGTQYGTQYGTQTGSPALSSSYPAELTVDYSSGTVITLQIRDNSNGYNGQVLRFSQSNKENVYYNHNQSIALVNANNVITIETPQGRIGRFQ